MRIDEVYFFRFTDGRISGLWGLEDTWTRMQQLAGDTSSSASSARSATPDQES